MVSFVRSETGECTSETQVGYQPHEIQERTFRFAVRVMRLVNSIPRSVAGQTIARQLARSGAGVGANVEEAQGAHSKADFGRRMSIARAEARESLYWLRLVQELKLVPAKRMKEIVQEADEIVRVLVAIVRNTRRRSGASSVRNS